MVNPDTALLRLMRTRGHTPKVERAAQEIARSGEWGAIWCATGLIAAAVDRPRRTRWLKTAAIGPTAIVLNFGVKFVVRRRRPVLEGLPPLGGAPSSLSFPSAHATASFAAATAMGRVAPGQRIPLLAGASLMSVTRPYLGMHYPSDIVAGAVLGSILGRLVPGLDASESVSHPTPSDRGSDHE